jgi:cytochrome bd-type quinol oxidase subunit 2
MPNIHTLPLLLFVLFDIIYIITCVFLYAYLLRAVRKRTKSKQAKQLFTTEKFAIIGLTLLSVYFMSKWIVLQMLHGCTTTFFWNHTCYDLNTLCRPWLLICVVVGINAIALSIMVDFRMQTRNVHRK